MSIQSTGVEKDAGCQRYPLRCVGYKQLLARAEAAEAQLATVREQTKEECANAVERGWNSDFSPAFTRFLAARIRSLPPYKEEAKP